MSYVQKQQRTNEDVLAREAACSRGEFSDEAAAPTADNNFNGVLAEITNAPEEDSKQPAMPITTTANGEVRSTNKIVEEEGR